MKSLRRFLLTTSLPAVTALALGAAWVGYDGSRHEADEVFDARLMQYAELIASAHADQRVSGVVGPSDHAALTTPNGEEPDYQTMETFQIWREGERVLHSGLAPVIPPTAVQPGFQDLLVGGMEWRVYALKPHPEIWVIVSESLRVRDELALAIAGAALLPVLIGIPVIGLLLWWMVSIALRRIDRVAVAVEARTPRELSPVPTADTPRELRGLLNAINGLLTRLRAGIEREKRFAADAAHELRTPITGAQINLDNARLAPELSDSTRQSLEQAREGLGRMAHIVDQLLRLSRAVSGDERLDRAEFDLRALLDALIRNQAPTLEARQQTLTTDIDSVVVHGHAPLLEIAVGNLLSNASLYTPRGGRIRISCHQTGTTAFIAIEDSGPGMAESFIRNATDRFQRGGESPHDDALEGCGLGLAIVQRIVEQHDATLQLSRSESLGGLCARIELSLAKS